MPFVFKAEALTRAIEAIALAGGSHPEEARRVAENLVMANLSGHDSHGVGMLPRYVDAVAEGGLVPNASVKVNADIGTMLAPNRMELCYMLQSQAARLASCVELTRQP